MQRIPPSERIRKRLDEVLSRGLDTEEDIATLVLRLRVERLVQVSIHAASRQLLEQEVSDHLGRERYWLRRVCDQRRDPGQKHKGYRPKVSLVRQWIRTSPSQMWQSHRPNRRRADRGAGASGAVYGSLRRQGGGKEVVDMAKPDE